MLPRGSCRLFRQLQRRPGPEAGAARGRRRPGRCPRGRDSRQSRGPRLELEAKGGGGGSQCMFGWLMITMVGQMVVVLIFRRGDPSSPHRLEVSYLRFHMLLNTSIPVHCSTPTSSCLVPRLRVSILGAIYMVPLPQFSIWSIKFDSVIIWFDLILDHCGRQGFCLAPHIRRPKKLADEDDKQINFCVD
jgi:hypothetical protein